MQNVAQCSSVRVAQVTLHDDLKRLTMYLDREYSRSHKLFIVVIFYDIRAAKYRVVDAKLSCHEAAAVKLQRVQVLSAAQCQAKTKLYLTETDIMHFPYNEIFHFANKSVIILANRCKLFFTFQFIAK